MKPRDLRMKPVNSIDSMIQGPHGPILVRRYSPPIGMVPFRSAPIVWIHGGGFFKGNLDQPESHDVARSLAAAGFQVVTVDYRLATLARLRWSSSGFCRSPAVHYPVPVDDVVAVVRAVQLEVPNGVILGGASAGACLSAGAVLRMADDGAAPLAGVFFAYGLFHAALPKRARTLRRRLRGKRRFVHTPTLLNLTNLHYAGTRSAMLEAHAFPGGHPLHDFPPTLMIDADRDSMRASGGQFARELQTAGIAATYHVLPDSLHAFLNRPNEPGFADGLELIIGWARDIQSQHA
ncbi:alpha/beta hydrolase [Cryobacterium sp. PH31-O1]|uniref:alpha/beta hydrolase n=1 Tax=Cryobacterium sp. PH31-O1 TaxID=3046306 RepID=UPI0024BA9297|nr:alpha/beta hydrolase [Cryobacterium sp. PH31-O1]MDJ0337144.1 alpha/beta hydrolase [Cryobacterium sp. PH31-O1]